MVSTRSARQRELGQNFLVDRNILGVIERLASLHDKDVVLEIGGGGGVLSARLARTREPPARGRARRPPAGPLSEALAPFHNVTPHFSDALDVEFAALRAGAQQGRRKPPVRDRRDGDPEDDRRASRACASGS